MRDDLQYQVEGIIAHHEPPTPPQRKTVLRPAAQAYSQRVIMRAHAANMRSILEIAIGEFYRETADGRLWNVGHDGSIAPVPWGRRGYRRWKVRRMYAECLRYALMSDQTERSLMLWDQASRNWYLNLQRYPNRAAALGWLDSWNLDAEKAFSVIDYWKFRQTGVGSPGSPQG